MAVTITLDWEDPRGDYAGERERSFRHSSISDALVRIGIRGSVASQPYAPDAHEDAEDEQRRIFDAAEAAGGVVLAAEIGRFVVPEQDNYRSHPLGYTISPEIAALFRVVTELGTAAAAVKYAVGAGRDVIVAWEKRRTRTFTVESKGTKVTLSGPDATHEKLLQVIEQIETTKPPAQTILGPDGQPLSG